MGVVAAGAPWLVLELPALGAHRCRALLGERYLSADTRAAVSAAASAADGGGGSGLAALVGAALRVVVVAVKPRTGYAVLREYDEAAAAAAAAAAADAADWLAAAAARGGAPAPPSLAERVAALAERLQAHPGVVSIGYFSLRASVVAAAAGGADGGFQVFQAPTPSGAPPAPGADGARSVQLLAVCGGQEQLLVVRTALGDDEMSVLLGASLADVLSQQP